MKWLALPISMVLGMVIGGCSSGLALTRTHQWCYGLAFGRACDNHTRYPVARDAARASFFGEGMARTTGSIAADAASRR